MPPGASGSPSTKAAGWTKSSGAADGLWALHTEPPRRGLGAMFFRAPVGAEVAGPCFTPDGESLFLSVQHPAKDGAKSYAGFERASSFEDAATHWPDFDPALPPGASVDQTRLAFKQYAPPLGR